MEVEIKMPDLSTTGAALTVLKWLVEVGESVRRGQALFEVETDKATMEVESVRSGVLKKQLARPNETVAAGDVIAVIEVQEKNPVSVISPQDHQSKKPFSEGRGIEDRAVPSSSLLGGYAALAGSPRGMFAKNRNATRQTPEHSTVIPLNGVQHAVARRMLQSKQTIPHFYLQTTVRMDPICVRRKEGGSNETIAWDAFFVCATAKSLTRFPKMCYRFQENHLVSQARGTVGVAVDVAGDLYVIPISNAIIKTPDQVSREIRNAFCRLQADDCDEDAKRLQPADITITNLGMTAVESFAPIINPPEAAILGIGKVRPQPVVVDSRIVVENRTALTLAVDHRVVNGKYAAEFLSSLVEELESF